LLVMAAGMGSRYGGIKQIDGFGPGGETIMDYSLFDCIREGFGQVVFVVREEILDTVRNMFLPKLQGKVMVDFVIQSLDKFVPPAYQPVNRKKLWGTTHAMLCGREVINGPFAVINADDFYGREAFASLAQFFKTAPPHEHAMVGYTLRNVLSDHGSVSRGVAEADAAGFLVSMTEHTTIVHEHGKIISRLKDDAVVLDPVAPVSMNCWGFQVEVFDLAEKMFHEFVAANYHNPGAEIYIALLVTELIERKLGKVKILPGGKTWFGVTYQEDKQTVSSRIRELVQRGDYPQKLW
ncbi:MAG: nucleotidyltransferase, partial [Cyclobacteriaceae bacterium]